MLFPLFSMIYLSMYTAQVCMYTGLRRLCTERTNKYTHFCLQEIIVQLLRDAMLENPKSPGFLIDGFPRELGQAKQFEDEVSNKRELCYEQY